MSALPLTYLSCVILLEPGFLVEGRDRLGFILIHLENFFQLHQIEHFFDIRVNVANPQVDIGCLALLAEQDQFSDHRRGHKVYVFEVDQNLVVIARFEQVDQFLAKILNSGFINNPDILKVNQQNILFESGQQS